MHSMDTEATTPTRVEQLDPMMKYSLLQRLHRLFEESTTETPTARGKVTTITRILLLDKDKKVRTGSGDRFFAILRKDPVLLKELLPFLENTTSRCDCGHTRYEHKGNSGIYSCEGKSKYQQNPQTGKYDWVKVPCKHKCKKFTPKPLV